MAQDNTRLSSKLKALNNDTLRYIKEEIISRKNFYIGKPLDSLLKDLPMSAKRYINPPSSTMSVYPATYIFTFYQRNTRIAQKKDPLDLIITWQTPLQKSELTYVGLQAMGGEWTEAAYRFFKSRIISDIGLVKYNF